MPAIPTAILAAVNAYAARLRERFGSRLRLVRLFGSWARCEAHDGSDVDVAAVVEGLDRNEWREAIACVVDVELEAGVALSPFVISGDRFDELRRRERRIARDIVEEGVAL